jgi:eukaryotic-like serine/threonine-protein kinase
VDLEEYLGGGRFGCVYAGRVRSTGLLIAVKILRSDRSETDEQRARGVIREAMIGARLSHRNIMGVFDVRPVGQFWIILMELVQGDRLSDAELDESSLIHCFGGLADAICSMAERQIVHRDIKPDNIVLRRFDRSPVIVDLGLAVDLAVTGPEDRGFAGSPRFMPPEAFNGTVTTSFDAYSLGVTAFDVLTRDTKPGSELELARTSGCQGVR